MGPARAVSAVLTLIAVLACAEAPTEPVAQDFDVPQYARGGQAKVQVCHRQGNGGWRLTTVGLPSVAAHKAHGDAEPGEAVPGSGDTQVFGASCEVLPAFVQQLVDFEAALGQCTVNVLIFAGFNWLDFIHYNNAGSCTTGNLPGFNAGVTSGQQAVWNNGGQEARVSATNNPFRMESAFVTAAWNTGMQLRVTGLLGGTPVYQQFLDIMYASPTLLTFNNALVDQVRFLGVGGGGRQPRRWQWPTLRNGRHDV